jgi:hypothetical protein
MCNLTYPIAVGTVRSGETYNNQLFKTDRLVASIMCAHRRHVKRCKHSLIFGAWWDGYRCCSYLLNG